MKAGFAKACITPPPGTKMAGFWTRDREPRGAESVHDDLHVRALYLQHDGEEALLAGFDLLFFSRANADRLKGAVGRTLDLAPRNILINTSHTHSGPCVDTVSFNGLGMPDLDYMDDVELAFTAAAREARDGARDVSVWAGATRSRLPVSRRRPDGKGGVRWGPDPDGLVCDRLPVCLLKDEKGKPVCLLFSVACHPTTTSGWAISAEYPGVACARLDEHLGATCSLFLQGAGGDAKPRVVADGPGGRWRNGDWGDVAAAGAGVAEEVIGSIQKGLRELAPALCSHLIETEWPLQSLPTRQDLERLLGSDDEMKRRWVEYPLRLLDRGRELAARARLLAHGVRLAEGLRIVALEGELVGELGLKVVSRYPQGITFALGYSNGTGLYLPASHMLAEGGYEVESHLEYGYAAPLAEGVEKVIDNAVAALKEAGIR